MIRLTRINGRPFVLNSELIKTLESTPDSMITLVHGEQIVVKEPLEDIVRRALDYARSVRAFPTD